MPLSLAHFNGLPPGTAAGLLAGCCAAPDWTAAVAAGRPYASLEALGRRSDQATAALSVTGLRAALAGHPRIGARAGPGWSRQEQAGVDPADGPVLAALAAGNQQYEDQFGHIYLVCATGRSGPELLALLRERLGHDPDHEWDVVRAELAKINRIRLGKLIGE